MRKIGVITDVHGNLPALQAILARLQAEKVEEILHLGDVVDMGPYSAECLHLLCQTPNVTMLMGNHDKDFVMNDYIAKHLSHVPTEHKKFVFGGLTEDDRQIVARFPVYAERICGGAKLQFVHYAYDRNNPPKTVADICFKWIEQHPTAEGLDKTFDTFDGEAVFFGHKHEKCDIQGKMIYVDVGSVGCHPEAEATGIVIDYDDNGWSYRRVSAPYDMESLRKAMSEMPCGEQIFDFYFMRKHVTY